MFGFICQDFHVADLFCVWLPEAKHSDAVRLHLQRDFYRRNVLTNVGTFYLSMDIFSRTDRKEEELSPKTMKISP